MISCKHCQNQKMIKNGIVKGKQRYLCTSCKKTTRQGDDRVKYSLETKRRVLQLYTEGMGIRAIERLEKIAGSLIVDWLRSFGKLLDKKLKMTPVADDAKEVPVLEVDELFSYCQKKT